MESRIRNIEASLSNNNETHPNLIKIWKEYICIKKQNLETALTQCERMLEKISSFEDQSPEQLAITSGIIKMVFANTT